MSGETEFLAALKDRGILDAIKDDDPDLIDRPAEEEPSSTGEQPRDPETGRFVNDEEEPETEEPVETTEDPEDEEPETEEIPAEEDDEVYLEIDDEIEEFLSRHDGDINKALKAAIWLDGVRGRQGNEMGELRQELEQLRSALEKQPVQQYQYQWPDEETEPEDAVHSYRSIAETSLNVQDQGTFLEAMASWHDIDPVGAETYATLKAIQAQALQVQTESASNTDNELNERMTALTEKHPDIREYVDDIGALTQEFPTLRGLMENGAPAEKAQAFEELYRIAKTRQNADKSDAAIRRVAVRRSEEARNARAEARVTSGQRAVTQTQEPESPVEAWKAQFAEKAKGRVDVQGQIRDSRRKAEQDRE